MYPNTRTRSFSKITLYGSGLVVVRIQADAWHRMADTGAAPPPIDRNCRARR